MNTFFITTLLLIFIGISIYLLIKIVSLNKKYEPLIDVDNYVKKTKERFEEEIIQKNRDISSLSSDLEKLKLDILNFTCDRDKIKIELDLYEEASNFQNYSFYKPKYYFENSEMYKNSLNKIYEKQKNMIKDKKAAICTTEWTVGKSKTQGKKMTTDNLKMMLRAFNGESDSAIAKVKHNNISVMENRINKSFETINKLNSVNTSYISKEYLTYKLEELYLNYEYAQKLEEEKEEQRLIKEQIREEEKAKKEYEKAIKEAEMEEARNQKALEKAKREYETIMSTKSEEEKMQFLEQIAELEKKLEEAHQSKERAISQAQLTRSGHVYIISNIGSFGENIYKIGMTRRLDPLDRVKELSGASVPFPFDVHAMIYSKDAPTLESELHKNFNDKSVNLINMRKEFFNVKLDEIEKFVINNHGSFRLTKLAEASQYRETLAMRVHNNIPKYSPNNEDLEDERIS